MSHVMGRTSDTFFRVGTWVFWTQYWGLGPSRHVTLLEFLLSNPLSVAPNHSEALDFPNDFYISKGFALVYDFQYIVPFLDFNTFQFINPQGFGFSNQVGSHCHAPSVRLMNSEVFPMKSYLKERVSKN